MSDLIDFDSPSSSTSRAPLLASPLIPSPDAGPFVFTEARRSMENNPFDMVLKKITDYEKNKEDPFERVIEKAMSRVSIETKDDFIPKRTRHSDILKMNKTFDETESKLDLSLRGKKDDFAMGVDEISIITDLNDTNLIADTVGEKISTIAWDCDKKVVPELNVSPTSSNADLSILNQSAMNDSLSDDQLLKESNSNNFLRPRSMSVYNLLSPDNLVSKKNNRRSMSVTDAPKSAGTGNDSTLTSVQSSLFEDPFNNGFRTTSLKSNMGSSSFSFNSQLDLSTKKQIAERLNSDSSVFSGLSNISVITADSVNKVRQDRFYSESSVCSNISNLSIIPNNTVTSSDSSVFVNDTLNKGFVNSRSQLSSTSSITSGKTLSKADEKSDLIKKFYQIKSRISMSQINPECDNNISTLGKSNSLLKPQVSPMNDSFHKTEEKLIDVRNNSTSTLNNGTLNDLISQEARTLAETFEKMASSMDFQEAEEDLLFSDTQFNFDDLPPSDDEAVDNLIELSGGESKVVTEANTEPTVMSPKDEMKALESEFIDKKDSDKKATAATLLLDLEKLIKEQDNPDAYQVLNSLQKMFGVHCDNNTEILKECFQNSMPPKDGKRLSSEKDSSSTITDNVESNELNSKNNNESIAKEILEERNSNSSNDIADLDIENQSKDVIISDDVNLHSESRENSKRLKNDDSSSEDQKLALNLLRTLNTIVSKNDEDSTVDVLKSLGTILSMASELRTNKTEKKVSEQKDDGKVKVPKQMHRSISSLYKSPSRTSLAGKKTQNTSFETLPLRRSISVNPSSGSNTNLLNVPSQDKRKSHLLNLKKRFPSDPGFADTLEKKKLEAAGSKPNLGANKSTIEPIKTKLKKKSTAEVVSKKGPMKAIIPLGSMQKLGVNRTAKESVSLTPPPKAQESVPAIKIISSTPNSSANSKSKPTASSTPNALEKQRVKTVSQNSSKGKLACNLSPVSLNSSSSMNTSKKTERSGSPNKKPSTPRKNDSADSSRLPRYSPRPVRVRNYSFSDVKSAKSPQPTNGSLKVASETIQRHSSVLSPLRNSNKLATKPKAMSLMPKLNKSSSAKTGPEKENYA